MAKRFVEYTGPSDVRELTSADFRALGVEDGKKESFRSGQVYEMDGAVVDALAGAESLVAGEFSEVDADQVEVIEDDETPSRSRRRESNPPAVSQSGAASGDTGAASTGTTTGGRTRTGRGSTAGST